MRREIHATALVDANKPLIKDAISQPLSTSAAALVLDLFGPGMIDVVGMVTIPSYVCFMLTIAMLSFMLHLPRGWGKASLACRCLFCLQSCRRKMETSVKYFSKTCRAPIYPLGPLLACTVDKKRWFDAPCMLKVAWCITRGFCGIFADIGCFERPRATFSLENKAILTFTNNHHYNTPRPLLHNKKTRSNCSKVTLSIWFWYIHVT